MSSAPTSRYLLYLLASVAFLTLTVSSVAQSSSKQAYRLEVLSPQYLPEKGVIEYKLVNHGTSAVNAYNVGLSLLVGGKEVSWMGHGLDMLDPELFLECRSASAGVGVTTPEDEVAMPEAIQPGEVFAQSLQFSNNSALNGAIPEVRVSIAGIIWADGKMEGNPDGPGGTKDLKHVHETRLEEAASEEKVLAIVNAHPEDSDIHHRIGEVIAGLQALGDGYPRETRTESGGKTVWAAPPLPIGNFIANLKIAAMSPAPKEMLDFFSSLWTCEHERRVAILGQGTSIAKSAQ